MPDDDIDPLTPFKEAPKEIQMIMKRVLKFEKDRLYQKTVQFNDQIKKIVMEEIK